MSDSIRTKEEMFNSLIKIIKSKTFKRKLAKLNDNFFNLKQKIHIRNLLVELFNKKFKKEGERAIAEYRVNPNKNIRIDLALINKPLKERILIEFKYHFPEDRQIKKLSLLADTLKKEPNVIISSQLFVMIMKKLGRILKMNGLLKIPFLQIVIPKILNGEKRLRKNLNL